METRAAGRPSTPGWTPDVGSGLIVACSLLLAATVVVGRGVEPVAAMLIVLSALVAWHRWILSWQVLVCLVIASVLFVPVGRYALAIKLPFGLEFYRLTVAFVLLVWVASLLVDPAVRLRRTPLDGPVALIVAASLCSVAVNFGRVAPLASAVLKSFTLFLSFIVFFYFIASVVSTVSAVVAVTKFIVSGAAVVAAFAVVEQRTGFNVFDHVRTVLPFLQFDASARVSGLYAVRTHPGDRVCRSSDRARCPLGDVPPARVCTRTIAIDPVVGPDGRDARGHDGDRLPDADPGCRRRHRRVPVAPTA